VVTVKKYILLMLLLTVILPVGMGQVNAPVLPQKTLSVNKIQDLCFGSVSIDYTVGGSGTVTIDPSGNRSRSGNAFLLSGVGEAPQQGALSFKLCPGRVVTVNWSPAIYLNHTSSSASILLNIHQVRIGTTLLTSSGQSFASNKGCNEDHLVEVGGIITLSGNQSNNPPGQYSGDFYITLAQQ
jgi:hypothetical protein